MYGIYHAVSTISPVAPNEPILYNHIQSSKRPLKEHTMRRTEQEITQPSEIDEIIAEADVCRLGMSDGDQPYTLPVNFGYKPGTFFIHGAGSGRKIDVLKANPKVCIEIDLPTGVEEDSERRACNYGYGYRSIIAEGTARFIDDTEEKREALSIIVKKYDPDNDCDFPGANLSRTIVIAVDVAKLTAKRSS